MLKQVSYDYERMQYNTVVSGAMKLLNALEGFKAEGHAAAVRDGFSVLLRVLYPADAAHRRPALAGPGLRRRTGPTCSTRPGPRS